MLKGSIRGSLSSLGAVFFYLLLSGCASGGGGQDTPVPAPTIISFTPAALTIPAGTATTLTAVFTNGTGSVNQSVGAVASGIPVSTGDLSATATFTLTVTNSAGSVTQQVTVNVTPPPVACTPTSKKGVGAWGTSLAPNAIDQLNISWFYDWATTNSIVGYTGPAIFVPEFWNGAAITKISGNSPWVFTFNEPNVTTQSNMTVDQAIADWPTVVADADGKMIGSPDMGDFVSGGGSWMSSFMSSAEAAGYEVDFLAIHVYPMGVGTATSDQVSSFENYVLSVHAAYPSYPIVINEFALVNRNTWDATGMTPAAQAAFVSQVVPWMEAQPWIIGYSWFAAYQGGVGSDLLNSDGTLTPIGVAYSQVGCQ